MITLHLTPGCVAWHSGSLSDLTSLAVQAKMSYPATSSEKKNIVLDGQFRCQPAATTSHVADIWLAPWPRLHHLLTSMLPSCTSSLTTRLQLSALLLCQMLNWHSKSCRLVVRMAIHTSNRNHCDSADPSTAKQAEVFGHASNMAAED